MATVQLLNPAADTISGFEREPEWFSKLRRKALEIYRSTPPETNPLYTKYAYISKFEDEGLTPVGEKQRGSIPAEYKDFAGKGTFFEDAKHIFIPELPDGVTVLPIAEAIEKEKVRQFILNAPVTDKFEALNLALLTGGYFIEVGRNANVEDLLHFIHVDNKEGSAEFRLNIVHLEDGAHLSLIEEKVSSSLQKKKSLFSESILVFLENAASLYYSSFEYFSPSSIYLSSRKTFTGRDSNAHWIYSYLGAALTRSRGDIIFNGQGSSAEDYEVIFGNGQQRFDVVTDLHHNVPDTSGRVTARSVLRDRSMSLLRGMIRIAENGKNTSAYLAEHGMLLSGEARCEAIPGLEILTNGVKATHSASVSQLDEEQLYYLQTRGLPREEAEKLMVLGFFDPLISRIPLDKVREKIRFQIEDKWNNELSLKADRHLDEIEFERYVKDQIKTTGSIFEGHYKYR